MVKVQVRVGEQETPQFSRLATLAGVTPPMTAADLHSAEQKQLRSQSRRERSPSKCDGTSKYGLLSVRSAPSGLMVNALDSRTCSPGSSPTRGHCVVPGRPRHLP